ncbi:hypothetical protein PFISCL1PPCAC_10486, partial [Pristionchus fissidentatus]
TSSASESGQKRMSRRGHPPAHFAPPPHTAAQSLGFPSCCEQALEQVSRVVAATCTLPAQNRARQHNNDLQMLLDRDLFCLNDRKTCRLTQIQRFKLLRELAAFFVQEEAKFPKDDAQKNAYRYGLFETIFLGREGESMLHAARLQVLFKLASYSVQHPSLSIFVPMAQWLRKMIGRTSHPEELIGLLVEHFILPDPALRMYEFLLPIPVSAPEFGFIFLALAPRDNCVGYAMASIAVACLYGNYEEFLEMMADFPDKLAVPFAKHSFMCLAKYALQKDESDEEEDEKARNNEEGDKEAMEVEEEEGKENEEDEKEKEKEDDPEEGEVPLDSLEQRLSRALAIVVNGWNVRGVKLEIDGDILSKMTSTTRRRNLVEALGVERGKKVAVKK